MVLLFDFIDRQFIHHPPEVYASFENRTIIVTGASSGLGLAATRLLGTLRASRIILAVRNVSKGEAAVSSIRESNLDIKTDLEVWPLDLSSFASVLAFADRAVAELPRLDALIANAGIWPRKYHRTTDGHEEALQTNVLATTLLACALHPILAHTAAKHHVTTHITFTGSELYEFAAFKEWKLATQQGRGVLEVLNDEKTAGKTMGDRYHTTKLLITLVARRLAAISPVGSDGVGVVVNVNAPG
jgi:NAD(P)-dependent dehydrogenase (short-subunit alcohol dehydrogenase family)